MKAATNQAEAAKQAVAVAAAKRVAAGSELAKDTAAKDEHEAVVAASLGMTTKQWDALCDAEKTAFVATHAECKHQYQARGIRRAQAVIIVDLQARGDPKRVIIAEQGRCRATP